MRLLTILFFSLSLGFASQNLKFGIFKKGDNNGSTVLIVGGIQGDEPGGFSAASLLVRFYKISNGSLWIIPNLNVDSIIDGSRGLYGDMNRKFLSISQNDRDYEAIERVKELVIDEDVGLVLNLHDGSGFYRPNYEDKLRNPNRWGQSLIFDQSIIDSKEHSDLESIAIEISDRANLRIKDVKHFITPHNTHTNEGDKEMEKTLTYFAVRNKKPAFGIEASKEFLTHERAFYHLAVIEEFLRYFNINFERPFKLNPNNIQSVLYNDSYLSINDNRVKLDLTNIKSSLQHIPFDLDSNELKFKSNNPLVSLIKSKNIYRVYIGNKRVTTLFPDNKKIDKSLESVNLIVDGEVKEVKIGSIVDINQSVQIESKSGYRVNAIGFSKKGVVDESNITFSKSDFMKGYSIDRAGKNFRIEIYRDDNFAGMVLVRFK